MNVRIMKLISATAIACVLTAGTLAPAFAGSAGAADSRGPQWPNGDGGGWQGNDQRRDHWHGDGNGYRRDNGLGLAPFVFGGLAAGAAPDYEPAYSGDSCEQLRPTYDQWNNYTGRRWVNVCE